MNSRRNASKVSCIRCSTFVDHSIERHETQHNKTRMKTSQDESAVNLEV